MPRREQTDPAGLDELGHRLSSYAAAAGAALACAANADAAVYYSSANVTLNSGNPQVDIDLNSDGTKDVRFIWQSTNWTTTTTWTNMTTTPSGAPTTTTVTSTNTLFTRTGLVAGLNGAEVGVSAGTGYASNFRAGDPIDLPSPDTWGAGNKVLFRYISTIGAFSPAWATASNRGYIGLRFDPGTGERYAWAYVCDVAANGTSYRVVDYAYGEIDTAITAGDGRPDTVPEPSSIALGLLACGAAGLTRSRRRGILKSRGDRSEPIGR